jgi:DNA-binding NarL/FixJ family response regulator
MITVLLVDHPAAVLRALRESLLGQEQISIVGEASSRDRALRLAETLRPQAVVLDADMPDVNVPELLGQLHTCSPASAIVVLTLEPTRLAGQFGASLPVEIVSKIDGVTALVATIRRSGRG